MSGRNALVLRNGFIGTCAFAALLLLASFYSIVSGAVERAARHRIAAHGAATTTLGAAAPQRQRAPSLLARVGD